MGRSAQSGELTRFNVSSPPAKGLRSRPEETSPVPGFGIYVHWPFCLAKCPYCDFNSHVRKGVDQTAWRDALTAELRVMAELLDERPPVDSIFFGGGTPSLMEGETVAAVLDTAAREFTIAPDVEITLEANPTSVDASRFHDYRAAGVNRLSLGVQALDDADLKRLGRWHSADEAIAALRIAQSTFPRVSLDLIYARPGQTTEEWRKELSRAITFGTEHLSLYQLTIEPGTPFETQYQKGLLRTSDEDLASDLFSVTQELCDEAGLFAYEISNHARPGGESRHNLVYWRYGEYLGVGPGAHGRLTHKGSKRATLTTKKPEDWLASVQAKGLGLESIENVSRDEQAREMLLMGLRLAEGIDPLRYEAIGGKPLDRAKLAALMTQGLLRPDQGRVVATPAGRLVLNAVIAELA